MNLRHVLKLRTLTIVVLTVVLTLLAHSAIAQEDPPLEVPQPEAVTILRGSVIDQVVKVRESAFRTTRSREFVNLPGARASITIPTGARGIIEARYSAESACYRVVAGTTGYCSIRILVNATEMQPAAGLDFAFDSHNQGNQTAQSWESHAMERSSAILPAGNYTVQVQWAVTADGVEFRLDDWHLTIDKVRVP